MRNLGMAIGACAFGMLIMASPAAAQTGVELSAGYNLLITEDDSVPVGWYVDVAKSVSGNIGVVGQVTGNYKSEEEAGVDIDLNLHTFLAGVRFSGANTSTTPFVQALVGAARSSGGTEIAGIDIGVSDTSAALQVGGGVNLRGASSLGFRIGADYLRTLGDAGGNAFRVAVGIVFGGR